ncbi:MAG: DUF2589 domain-containing protein [Bacteroidales bacterium]|uniref:DUF2589 domain-containing protein n=1 Tax=Porphyromonas sp. TaxID=1924944 RepID=UPI0029715AF7|nr:DUF2589 domain-containing protein [Porphyromonas sp.]MDD7438737.1 DUF2589 domain-containing protein [Bacteroidales bacterium]MDY3066995.1 DUF2589 domain-containing protein [Porphyromonas sp.]
MANIDTTPSLVATSALQAIPFGSIIGGPLKACIDAQAQAAQTTWEFIQQVGLQTDSEGNTKAINVLFEYVQGGRKMMLIVPLLTIVPIPYIAINDIEINFKAQISASASNSKEYSKSTATDVGVKASASYRGLFVKASAEMHANFSSKKDSKATQDSKYSVEYTMDVHVKAGQDSMPAGMAKVLEILNGAVDTVNAKGELSVTENMTSVNRPVVITFRDKFGVFSPQEVMWREADKTDNWKGIEKDGPLTLSGNGESVIATFEDEGNYYVKGGECEAFIVVTP